MGIMITPPNVHRKLQPEGVAPPPACSLLESVASFLLGGPIQARLFATLVSGDHPKYGVFFPLESFRTSIISS